MHPTGRIWVSFPLTVAIKQCFGSGSGLDPDSIRSVAPDSEFGSGHRRAKITCKNIKKLTKIHVFLVLDVPF